MQQNKNVGITHLMQLQIDEFSYQHTEAIKLWFLSKRYITQIDILEVRYLWDMATTTVMKVCIFRLVTILLQNKGTTNGKMAALLNMN
jgi:hypothetical protein